MRSTTDRSIIKKIGTQSYKLALPPQMGRIHPVFHVALLESYARGPNFMPGPISHPDALPDRYEVEDIVDHKMVGNTLYFYVKWLGYPYSDCTWEEESNLDNCEEILHKYRERVGIILTQGNLHGTTTDPPPKKSDSEPTRRRGRGRLRGSKSKMHKQGHPRRH
jgi:hypothetical protein